MSSQNFGTRIRRVISKSVRIKLSFRVSFFFFLYYQLFLFIIRSKVQSSSVVVVHHSDCLIIQRLQAFVTPKQAFSLLFFSAIYKSVILYINPSSCDFPLIYQIYRTFKTLGIRPELGKRVIFIFFRFSLSHASVASIFFSFHLPEHSSVNTKDKKTHVRIDLSKSSASIIDWNN